MIEVLNLFNAVVAQKSKIDTSCIAYGVVTDFKITHSIKNMFIEKFKQLPVKTLFGKEERITSNMISLVEKQILAYIETYGLNAPGLFELEVTEGYIVKPTFVQAITVKELSEKVLELLYANRPIKNSAELVAIIQEYKIKYDFDLIQNNEMRIALYNPKTDKFKNGDEAIRYMVFKTTGDTLVIKNPRKIEEIKAGIDNIETDFFVQNEEILSQVFNRFKPLLLVAKTLPSNRNVINRIARKSKNNHVPVHEGVNKRFLSTVLNDMNLLPQLVKKIGVRDKFKMLNLIEYKLLGFGFDAFVIRNGTVHIDEDRKVHSKDDLLKVSFAILEELKSDLSHLQGQSILLDNAVHYGLPISRKQSLGNLPYGTTVTMEDELCSGIYWENSWGATDLDLSAVDTEGNRIGWGGYMGYSDEVDADPLFSGDVVNAEDGAMEFMVTRKTACGLFANIFSGASTAEFELVIGKGSNEKWITDVKIREKSKLTGRGSIIGFVNGTKFTVFQGKLNDKAANFGEKNPIISKALASNWTINSLLEILGIDFDVEATKEKYDFNLSYDTFSFDKLEEMVYS